MIGHLALAVGILALGFVIWILDITRTLCSPVSWLQGHAIWHVLGAVASWQLYLYHRSEESPGRHAASARSTDHVSKSPSTI